MSSVIERFRSSKTGRFVTEKYAAADPIGTLKERRRRRKDYRIDPVFAQIIAAQVKMGLARNPEPASLADERSWNDEVEQSALRARTALTTIGLLVRNASSDASVNEMLNLDMLVVNEDASTGHLRAVDPPL